MNIIKKIFQKHTKIKIILLVLIIGFIAWKLFSPKQAKTTYQTSLAEKGNLIVSVTASGTVSGANSASVTTQTSGVVKNIFVENGQEVKSGDPIAEMDLDMDGNQRASQALASYQNAKNSLDNAQTTMYTLQSTLFGNWQTYMDKAQNSTYQNPDGSPKNDQRQLTDFSITNDDWLAAEAKYKNQQNVIAAAQTSLNSAWASYQQASPIIYAPISGTISGLSLQIGSILTAQTSTSGNSSSQRIANIKTQAPPMITVNLTEIDVPKVKINNKATITLDALPDKTYTGKVISIDSTGSVSSGVTTYPAVIKLDTENTEIFPNMSTQASIITQVKNDILLIPLGSVQTQNGTSQVQILKNGQASSVTVETGLSSSTQIEITSGLKEGDEVVTNTVSGTTTQSSTQSIFSSIGGRNTFGGGVRRD
jgi:RND family efflux transporter MFP subunit